MSPAPALSSSGTHFPRASLYFKTCPLVGLGDSIKTSDNVDNEPTTPASDISEKSVPLFESCHVLVAVL